MAPSSLKSTAMDLLQPTFPKPQPLRVIKRSTTNSGDGTGSPPERRPDQMIVHKRMGRVFHASEGIELDELENINTQTDRCPAHHEVLDSSSMSSCSSIKIYKGISRSVPQQDNMVAGSSASVRNTVPQRAPSKGKRMMRKALRSLGSVRTKSVRSFDEHFSQIPTSHDPPFTDQARKASLSSYTSNQSSQDSSSVSSGVEHGPGYLRHDFQSFRKSREGMLYPHVNIVSETQSVDSREGGIFWVAITVVGETVVRECQEGPPGKSRWHNFRSTLGGCNMSDLMYPGYLYGMHVEVMAAAGCFLEQLIVQREHGRTLQHGQSRLYLAQIAVPPLRRTGRHARQSSDDLLEELEAQLGSATSEYVHVRVSYQHSLFSDCPGVSQSAGISHYATSLLTEVHAVIGRHVQYGPWTADSQKSISMDERRELLVDIITSHYASEEARDLIDMVFDSCSGEQVYEKPAMSIDLWDTSSDTAVYEDPYEQVNELLYYENDSDTENTPRQARPMYGHQVESGATTSLRGPSSMLEGVSADIGEVPLTSMSLDPARKIWSDMRRVSRGISDTSSTSPVSITSPGGSAAQGENYKRSTPEDKELQREQERIQEMVLKNKRSVGVDTLRSIALSNPSRMVGESGAGGGKGFWPWWLTGVAESQKS